MVIMSPGGAHQHALGFKIASTGGNSYFLDPNSGLWQFDESPNEAFAHATFHVNTNYVARNYAGGDFGTTKLAKI